MAYEFGLIGCGNMGTALAMAARKVLDGDQMLLANRTSQKAQCLAKKIGAHYGSNADVATKSHFIFLGVKPQMMPQLLADIAPYLRDRTDSFVLVTMAAGLTVARIQEMVQAPYPTIRIMPNTPVSIAAGMIQFSAGDNVNEDEKNAFKALLNEAGILDELPEALIDAGSAVSGCGPAFVDLFIEALADGGVKCGLPRHKAILYAAQMVMGSAKLALESGMHPAQLKDAVCSPGGSTIAGVHALECGAFRAAVINAVTAAYERTKELGK